jgi:DNA-binding transcriptional LysR family regulator
MDYRKLQLFMSAARHGNLTEAAVALEISQPALSKSIKALEKSLGVRLLERGRFGVTPTPYGLALMQHGQVMEAEMRHALSEIEALKGSKRGHILMGCGPTEANRLLPLALQKLSHDHPDVTVTVMYGLNEALMPWVKQGEIDFALSSVPSRSIDPELMHEQLCTDSAVVVARNGHPLSSLRTITYEQLMQYPWILPRQRELERLAFEDFFLDRGQTPPPAQVETTSTVLMKSLVMQSDALTFIPRELIYWEAQAGQLRALNVPTTQWTRLIGLTRRRKVTVSPPCQLLIDIVRSCALTTF